MSELNSYMNRRDTGVGAPMGRTEMIPLMGGGVKHILHSIQQAVVNLTAQGRHPVRNLRVIVCWQFNEFFHQHGPMKSRFPLEIQDDIKTLIELLNGLHSVAILELGVKSGKLRLFMMSGPMW